MTSLIVERPADGVLLLQLNRPEARNALNMELRAALADTLDAAANDGSVRAAVVTGDDQAFAAGADIRELAGAGPVDLLIRNTGLIWDRIGRFPKPLIAAVEGVALGGGCELALHCDIIIAGETARFGQPEVRLGLIPGGSGTQRLFRAVGKYKAMAMILTGEGIGAAEASAMGLVSRLVPAGTARAAAIEMAKGIAALPPLAVMTAKEVALAGQDASLAAAVSLERKAFYVLAGSQDKEEGIAAFLGKRPPDFRGR